MGLTNFPNGVSSFGMPQLGAGGHFTTGNVYFVDSGATGASDGNLGDSPGRPLATLNGAVTRATASNGDLIFLMPGHAENVSSATTQLISKAGLTIIGIGHGSLRPTFTYTVATGSFEMDAADCVIENIRFLTSVTAVVAGINVDAAGCTIRNCAFDWDVSGDDFLIMVDVQGVADCVIEYCDFVAESIAGSNKALRLHACDGVIVRENGFFGDYAAAVILGDSATADGLGVFVNARILGNFVHNTDSAFAQNGIDLNTAITGIISNNRISTLQATDVHSLLDPGSCLCTQNYAVNAVDEHGLVTPTTPST